MPLAAATDPRLSAVDVSVLSAAVGERSADPNVMLATDDLQLRSTAEHLGVTVVDSKGLADVLSRLPPESEYGEEDLAPSVAPSTPSSNRLAAAKGSARVAHPGYPVTLVDELERLSKDRAEPPVGDTTASSAERQTRIHQLVGDITTAIAPPGKGNIVAGCELVRVIGKGSFGAVWEALDVTTGEGRAVKVFDADRLGLTLSLYQFRRGVRAMQHLGSINGRPACVVHLLSCSPDRLAFSMPLLNGKDLENVRSRAWTPEKKIATFSTICRAVAFAHANNVIHRDIKPANIVMHDDGPVLTDFDIADLTFAKTMSVAGGGSFLYAAPEQLTGAPAHPTADVYSLGRILHYFLTEKDPPTRMEDNPLLRDLSGVPDGLVRIIRKCTQLDASRRYQTINDLLSDLETSGSPAASVGEPAPTESLPPSKPAGKLARAKETWTQAEAFAAERRWHSAIEAGNAALKLVHGEDYGLEGDWKANIEDWKARSGDTKAAGKAARRRLFGRIPLGLLLILMIAVPAIAAVSASTGLGKRLLQAILPARPAESAEPASVRPDDSPSVETTLSAEVLAQPLLSSPPLQREASNACGPGMVAFGPGDGGNLSFCLDKHEVTVGEYRACVADHKGCFAPLTSGRFGEGGLSNWEKGLLGHPMNAVSRLMADVYCTSLGKRLPELREWLYAAKDEDRFQWPWGSDKDPITGLCYKRRATCRVGEFAADPSGLQDMSGNVQEWTSTVFCPNGLACPPGSPHVTVGGHYDMDTPSKAYDRNAFMDGYAGETVGFRCAKDLR